MSNSPRGCAVGSPRRDCLLPAAQRSPSGHRFAGGKSFRSVRPSGAQDRDRPIRPRFPNAISSSKRCVTEQSKISPRCPKTAGPGLGPSTLRGDRCGRQPLRPRVSVPSAVEPPPTASQETTPAGRQRENRTSQRPPQRRRKPGLLPYRLRARYGGSSRKPPPKRERRRTPKSCTCRAESCEARSTEHVLGAPGRRDHRSFLALQHGQKLPASTRCSPPTASAVSSVLPHITPE